VNNKNEGLVGEVANFRYWSQTVVMYVLSLFNLAAISLVPTLMGDPLLAVAFSLTDTHCKDKILYRKFETYIPRKATPRLQSQFLHSCFCVLSTYSDDRSAYSAAGKYVDRSWEYINREQTH